MCSCLNGLDVQRLGVRVRGAHIRDYSSFGSVLGSPNVWKLLYRFFFKCSGKAHRHLQGCARFGVRGVGCGIPGIYLPPK